MTVMRDQPIGSPRSPRRGRRQPCCGSAAAPRASSTASPLSVNGGFTAPLRDAAHGACAVDDSFIDDARQVTGSPRPPLGHKGERQPVPLDVPLRNSLSRSLRSSQAHGCRFPDRNAAHAGFDPKRRGQRTPTLRAPCGTARRRNGSSSPLASAVPLPPTTHHSHETATVTAAQIWRIRSSLNLPMRPTSNAVETLSNESRLTAERLGTGSSPGSSTTSLGKPRIVVVQGPTITRLNRWIAASRERTTTGRRPTSGGSHHQTSPR